MRTFKVDCVQPAELRLPPAQNWARTVAGHCRIEKYYQKPVNFLRTNTFHWIDKWAHRSNTQILF